MSVGNGSRLMIVTALLTGTMGGATAQPATPAPATESPEQTEAIRLTEAGTAAWEAGKHALALGYFELAHQVFPSPRLHYNMGLALAGLRRDLEAVERFERFLAEAGDAPADNRVYAQEMVRTLGRRLGAVSVTTSVDGARLTVDGRDRPLHDWVHVTPGSHTLAVARAGSKTAVVDVEVPAGQRVTRRLDPRPTTLLPEGRCPPRAQIRLAPPPRPLPARGLASGRRGWLVAGAVGVLIAGAAAVALATGGNGAGCPDSQLGCWTIAR